MSESSLGWQVLLGRGVEKVLRRLPRDVLRRVDRALTGLADDPRPPDCTKLRGHEHLYRLRVGDWRIVYSVEDENLVVLVVVVAPRGRAYSRI